MKSTGKVIGAALVMALAHNSALHADDGSLQQLESELAELRSRVEAQQQELQRLRGAEHESPNPQQRAQEIRSLVREALEDSQIRPSLTAGYYRGLFIRSEDGNNELRIGLVGQIRYVHTHREEGDNVGDAADNDSGGLQLRRTQIDLQGHFINPRWTYRLRLDSNNGGNVQAAWAWVGYKLSDELSLRVGQLKPSFLHEENVGAAYQLAAERSYTSDYFTTDFSQGLQVTWQPEDRLRLTGTVHTGSYTWRTDFTDDGSDFAVTGRVEYLLADDARAGWRQFNDFSSWPGQQPAVLLGAAVDYERGESDSSGDWPDVLKWTADATAKFGGLGLFAAVTGQHFSVGGSPATGVPTNLDGASQIGVVAQASYFVVPNRVEPFARYEWIHFDDVYYRANQGGVQGGSRNLSDDDELSIVTAGVNYYFHKHDAKLTLDVLYALDPVPVANSGQGLLRSAEGDQLAVRVQFQFRF